MKLCTKPEIGLAQHEGHLPAWKNVLKGEVWCSSCHVDMKKVLDENGGYHWTPVSKFNREPSPPDEE